MSNGRNHFFPPEDDDGGLQQIQELEEMFYANSMGQIDWPQKEKWTRTPTLTNMAELNEPSNDREPF